MSPIVQRCFIASICLMVAAGVATTPLRADDNHDKLRGLSRAVSVVKVKDPKGEVTKAAKEDDGGRTIYEVVVRIEDKTLDVTVSAHGKILEVEQTVAAEKLPEAIISALQAKYPGARIKRAELVLQFEDEDDEEDEDEDEDDEEEEEEDDDDEMEQFFEVVMQSEGKVEFEVKMSPKGKILADDEDDKPSGLSQAIAAALVKYPKGEVIKAVKESEEGQTVYEIVLRTKGKQRELSVSAKGKIIEDEVEDKPGKKRRKD